MSLIPLKRNKQEWDHDNHPYSFDNPNIYMRPATEDDVDNMYDWEMESIDKSLQEDPKVQQLIRDDCYQSIKDTQMIMDQDKTIGMFTACMIDNGEWRYIGEIYLIPEYRGQHIGSTILKNEIANYDRIRLQVAFDNEGALRLYKSLGFKIVKENKEAKLYIMEYDKAKQISEGFVDRTIKHTLAGLKIPKLQPVDEKYLMDHKADYMKLYQDRGTITSSYYNLHYDTFKKTFGDKAKELYDALENLFAHIGFAKDFNIYNKYRLFLCKLLNMPINHVIALEGWYNRADMGQMRVKSKEDDEGIPLKSTDVLYHTSKIKGLTELQPTFVSRNSQDPFDFGKKLLSIEALYTSPRVYVGLNEPVGREGLGIGGLRIYKITNFKGKVKYDHELTGGAARFIETRSPVKVVDVTEEYIKAHQIQEAMNGVNASPVDDNFFRDAFYMEDALTAKDRNALENGDFALVYKDKNGKLIRKYPVHDEAHVKAASKMFPRGVPDEYKERVARRILREAKQYNLDTSGWENVHKALKKNVSESYVERNDFNMNEKITKILEAYNAGVITQEEATEKITSIQESVNEPEVDTLREKQDKIMESYQMGIINAKEGMQLIERVMMEADYINEGDDDDIETPENDGEEPDTDDDEGSNVQLLADYINSLSDGEKSELIGLIGGSDEPTDDDANGNEEVPTDDATPAEDGDQPIEEEGGVVDPASVSNASLNDANASLDDMEV